jgi:Rod binding domain-containing protein
MTSLPPIDQALLPADIRKAGDAERKQYSAALGFERTLINELTKVMAETAKPSDDDSQQQDAATSLYKDMLPDQLADSVVAAGGLGLARTLYEDMQERSK